MRRKSNRIIKACLLSMLAALGFTSCSKPDDDPVNQNPWGVPGVLAYGPPPSSYQESLDTKGVITDLPGTMPSVEPLTTD